MSQDAHGIVGGAAEITAIRSLLFKSRVTKDDPDT